jgi:hypothetical protein
LQVHFQGVVHPYWLLLAHFLEEWLSVLLVDLLVPRQMLSLIFDECDIALFYYDGVNRAGKLVTVDLPIATTLDPPNDCNELII